MIYLFNSAHSLTYLENVYRLLGMPEGAFVDMRYTEGRNAPDEGTDAQVMGSQCVICYIDRYDGNYKYFPFRYGQIRFIKREQGRAYYTIALGKHCHSENPQTFTQELQGLAESSPRLTNRDPLETNDGIYCLDVKGLQNNPLANSDSWSVAVDQIYETRAFSGSVPALFLAKVELDGKAPKGNKLGLKIYASKSYTLTILYKYPHNRNDGRRRNIYIRIGSEVTRKMAVGSASDRLELRFSIPPINFSSTAIEIETQVEEHGTTEPEIRYTATIPLNTISWKLNLFLFIALFMVIFVSEFYKIGFCLSSLDAWIAVLVEFLKFSIIIWAIFKYRNQLSLPGS